MLPPFIRHEKDRAERKLVAMYHPAEISALSVVDPVGLIENGEDKMDKLLKLLVLVGVSMLGGVLAAQTNRLDKGTTKNAGSFGSTLLVGSGSNRDIQTTITNAGATGNVIIPSSYAGTDSYINPNNIVILDLRTGTATAPYRNRTFATPNQYFKLFDNSVKTTSAAQADPFATPYQLIDVTDTSPNDAVPAYWSHFCNYTGGASPTSGNVGPCLGSIIFAGDSATDTHYGVWGQNTIVQTSASNNLVNMFGYELNQFNLTGADSNISSVNTFTRGPYYGFVATAAGNAEQVAAFVVDDESNIAGNTGSGWHNGLFVAKADNAAVLCGAPNFAGQVTTCISHSAEGTATASVNYPSVPDLQAANVWSGGTHAISRGFMSQLIPGAGSDPVVCETFIFDGASSWNTCSNGVMNVPGRSVLSGGAFIAGLDVHAHVSNDTGLQTVTAAVGCTTAATVGATCTSSAIAWTVPFADTAYRLTCTLNNPTGVPVLSSVNKAIGSFTVTIAALTAAKATGNIDCIAMHN